MNQSTQLDYDKIPEIPGGPIAPGFKEVLQSEVAGLLGLQTPNRFPGAQPISFELEHFDELKSKNFMVCEKSDGVRCLLYIRYNKDAKRQEVFAIDRKNDYKIIDSRVGTNHYNGFMFYCPDYNNRIPLERTIIDGELVVDRENGRLVLRYLAFDILAFYGKLLVGRNYNSRQGYLRVNVVEPFNYYAQRDKLVDRLPFQIEAKVMQRSYGMLEILNSASYLNHKSDGLIFTSEEDPYVMGTCKSMLKWKPPNENSVDFKLNIVDPQQSNQFPIFNLSIWEGGNNYTFVEEMAITRRDIDYFRKQFGNNYIYSLQNKIVEVSYDPNYCPGKRWRFMRFRDDKTAANHSSVYKSILKSIKDNVDVEKLKEEYNVMRNAYKARLGESTFTTTDGVNPSATIFTNLAPSNNVLDQTRSNSATTETKSFELEDKLDASQFAHIIVQVDQADSCTVLDQDDEFHDIGVFDESLPIPKRALKPVNRDDLSSNTETSLDDGTFDASLIPPKSPPNDGLVASPAGDKEEASDADDFFDDVLGTSHEEATNIVAGNEDSISHDTEEFEEIHDSAASDQNDDTSIVPGEAEIERNNGSKKRALADDLEDAPEAKKRSS